MEAVLSVSRKASGFDHPKLKEVIHKDFYNLQSVEQQFKGYDAVLFCLGISSVGISKEEYFKITYTLTTHFAETFHKMNPGGRFCYISGAGTDSKEKGNGWAAVKGKTENALIKIFGKNAYNFRPGFIKPIEGMKRINKLYKFISWIYPIGRKLLPRGFTNNVELGTAMANVALNGYSKQILEGNDIIRAARTI